MDFERQDLGGPESERPREGGIGAQPVFCPFCGRPIAYRLAQRVVVLYEGDRDEAWGERDVLTFDYLRYKPGYLLDCFRREWYREGDRIYEVCDDVMREAIAEWCGHTGVPKGIARKSFDSFEVTTANMQAFNACKQFAQEFSKESARGVALHGGVGVGKTHLAAATLVEIIRRGLGKNRRHDIRFYSIPRIFQEFRWEWGRGEQAEQASLFAELMEAELVVLDDLGASRLSEEELHQLFLFVDGRLMQDKPVIITTNLRASEIAVNVGERIADRLREACRWVEISGGTYRGRLLHHPHTFPTPSSRSASSSCSDPPG